MKILMVSTYFMPDVASTGVIMTSLAEDFAEIGHEVSVLTSFPHYGEKNGRDRARPPRRETSGGLRVRRFPVYSPNDRQGFKGRLLSYGSFSLKAGIRCMLTSKPDVVFIPSPPLTNGLLGGMLTMLRRVPFVYNVQDIWPDVLVRAGVIQESGPFRMLQAMERFVYGKAAGLAVISQGFRQNLLEKGVPDEKITVIPNFFDTDFVRPLPKANNFSREHSLTEKFVVLFAGNIGHSQGLKTVLDAAKTLESVESVEFLIVGDGASKASLQREAERLRLTNLRFLPFQPHERLPELYASADLCLVPLRRGFTNESVPCKVFNIMASGRPLIAGVDPGSDTWRLVEGAGCGLTLEPERPDLLARAIGQMVETPEEAAEMGARGREFAEKHYDRKIIARRYSDLLESVASP